MDQHSHTCWSHPHSHGCSEQGLTTFTGPRTREEPGVGEETVTPNPSCMKSNPSHGSHSATSPASAPHHELATQTLGSRRCCDKEMLPCGPRIPRQGCWDGVPLPHLDGGQEADPAEKNHLWDTPSLYGQQARVLPASWASPCSH